MSRPRLSQLVRHVIFPFLLLPQPCGACSYTVSFVDNDTELENVKEGRIRASIRDQKELEFAASLGFPEGWKASANGTRYTIKSPDGWTFKSKKAAIKHMETLMVAEDDDPPWRLTGHELIGQEVVLSQTHKVSGKRSVTVEQTGTVAGWIADTDTDRNGEPGYVCEATGKPANLFHVTFKDQPGHPHAKYLIDFQDMEEDEVRSLLTTPPVATSGGTKSAKEETKTDQKQKQEQKGTDEGATNTAGRTNPATLATTATGSTEATSKGSSSATKRKATDGENRQSKRNR